MARKSRIEPVKQYLVKERYIIIEAIDTAVSIEDYLKADQLKEFRRILSVAIQLCGEEDAMPAMPTSDKANYFIPPAESAMPGILPNRGED